MMWHFVRIRLTSFTVQKRWMSLKLLKPAKVSNKAHSSVTVSKAVSHLRRIVSGGEEPCDEMRRKGLGEEPRLAFGAGCKHASQKLNDIYVIELFAGTARLTKCLRKQGFQAMAFDRTSKRSEGQHILEADLSNREEVEALLSFLRLKADFIAFVHMAPPCGTAKPRTGKETEVSPKSQHQGTDAIERR